MIGKLWYQYLQIACHTLIKYISDKLNMTDESNLQEIRNYYPIDDYLATAGQPDINQFELIQSI